MNEAVSTSHDYQPPVDPLLRLGEVEMGSPHQDYAALGITLAHVPELIRMIADDGLHDAPGKSPLVWAPLHAWRALGQLQAEAAIGPLLGLLARIDDYDDDWVGEDLPRALSGFGAPALEPVMGYLADARHGEWARVAATEALAKLGEQHPELKTECVIRLSAQLEKFVDQPETLNAFLVFALVELGAVEALPVMARAFAAGHVDESVMGDYEDIEIELGVKQQREHPRGPGEWAKFADEPPSPFERPLVEDSFLGGLPPASQPAGNVVADGLTPYVRPDKVGRNDPCPCGSGKKYKKCCGSA